MNVSLFALEVLSLDSYIHQVLYYYLSWSLVVSITEYGLADPCNKRETVPEAL